jgi:hypothetical protein
MPKVRGAVPTELYRIRLPRVFEAYLEQLVATGTFGNNHEDAVRFLITKAVDALIEKGVLRRPSNTTAL